MESIEYNYHDALHLVCIHKEVWLSSFPHLLASFLISFLLQPSHNTSLFQINFCLNRIFFLFHLSIYGVHQNCFLLLPCLYNCHNLLLFSMFWWLFQLIWWFQLLFLLNRTEPNFWSGSVRFIKSQFGFGFGSSNLGSGSGSVHQTLVQVRFGSLKQRFGSGLVRFIKSQFRFRFGSVQSCDVIFYI